MQLYIACLAPRGQQQLTGKQGEATQSSASTSASHGVEEINQSINQSINQPTNHQPTNQSINQSINQSANQPTNQSINQHPMACLPQPDQVNQGNKVAEVNFLTVCAHRYHHHLIKRHSGINPIPPTVIDRD